MEISAWSALIDVQVKKAVILTEALNYTSEADVPYPVATKSGSIVRYQIITCQNKLSNEDSL